MKISERLRDTIDSVGPSSLWFFVAVAVVDALCGAFLVIDYLTGKLIFTTHPDYKVQPPWLFVVLLTAAIAAGSPALLRTSDTMWRSWLVRIGLPVLLLSVIIFFVADAQATSPEYIVINNDGVLVRPAFPYVRAVFAAFALVGQFALLLRLRAQDR